LLQELQDMFLQHKVQEQHQYGRQQQVAVAEQMKLKS
jgi:hypothetical protein